MSSKPSSLEPRLRKDPKNRSLPLLATSFHSLAEKSISFSPSYGDTQLARRALVVIMVHGRLARAVIPGLPHHVTRLVRWVSERSDVNQLRPETTMGFAALYPPYWPGHS